MMQLDGYRWEDRVPKPGRWKLDLVLGVFAFAMVALTLRPDLFAREPSARADVPAAQFTKASTFDAAYPDTAQNDDHSHAVTRTPCPWIAS